MEAQLLRVLQEVASGEKSPIIARDELLALFGVSSYPAWLDDKDFEFAKVLFKENKLKGIKYLYELAKPHEQKPLNWTKTFLESCC